MSAFFTRVAVLIVCCTAFITSGFAGDVHPLDRIPSTEVPIFTSATMAEKWEERSAAAIAAFAPFVTEPRQTCEVIICSLVGPGFASQSGLNPGTVILSLDGHSLTHNKQWDSFRDLDRNQFMAVRLTNGTSKEVQLPKSLLGINLSTLIRLDCLTTPQRRDPRWERAFHTAIATWESDPELALFACKTAAAAGFPEPDILHLLAAFASWQAGEWVKCIDHSNLALQNCPPELLDPLVEKVFSAAIFTGSCRLASRMLERYPDELSEYSEMQTDLESINDYYIKRPRPPAPELVIKDWPYDDLLLRTQTKEYSQARHQDALFRFGAIQLFAHENHYAQVYSDPGAETFEIDVRLSIKQDFPGLTGSLIIGLQNITDKVDTVKSEHDLLTELHIRQDGGIALGFGLAESQQMDLPMKVPLGLGQSTRIRWTVHAGWSTLRINEHCVFDGPIPGRRNPMRAFFHVNGANMLMLPTVSAPMRPEVWQRRFGKDPDQQGRLGQTLLHRVAAHGDVKMAKLLLETKASAQAVDDLGATPLHHAARNGTLNMVKLLLDAKADVNAVDCKNETPLDWSLNNNKEPEVLALLRARGGLPGPGPAKKSRSATAAPAPR